MSDGEPNEGKVGEELIAYADQIKQSDITIYTLGFFESLGDKSAAQALMEQIASDGCHYELKMRTIWYSSSEILLTRLTDRSIFISVLPARWMYPSAIREKP